MLACVCQPADTGIFRRSQVLLSASPRKLNTGAIPKPGRILAMTPVITSEPSANNSRSVMEKVPAKSEAGNNTSSSNGKLVKKKSKCATDSISQGAREIDAAGAQNSSHPRRRNDEDSARKPNPCDQVRMVG